STRSRRRDRHGGRGTPPPAASTAGFREGGSRGKPAVSPARASRRRATFTKRTGRRRPRSSRRSRSPRRPRRGRRLPPSGRQGPEAGEGKGVGGGLRLGGGPHLGQVGRGPAGREAV